MWCAFKFTKIVPIKKKEQMLDWYSILENHQEKKERTIRYTSVIHISNIVKPKTNQL